jgi:hypothetical protein
MRYNGYRNSGGVYHAQWFPIAMILVGLVLMFVSL